MTAIFIVSHVLCLACLPFHCHLLPSMCRDHYSGICRLCAHLAFILNTPNVKLMFHIPLPLPSSKKENPQPGNIKEEVVAE